MFSLKLCYECYECYKLNNYMILKGFYFVHRSGSYSSVSVTGAAGVTCDVL